MASEYEDLSRGRGILGAGLLVLTGDCCFFCGDFLAFGGGGGGPESADSELRSEPSSEVLGCKPPEPVDPVDSAIGGRTVVGG